MIMLTIGEFSKICKVTTRTLRHYDNIDLIKPIKINEENNYRYYDISQIRTMILISKLKKYNFSLEEIKQVILENDRKFIIDMMNLKKAEIHKTIQDFERLEKDMNNDLINLEKGFDIMSFMDKIEVKIVNAEDMNIISTRQIMSTEEYGKYIGKLFERVAKEKLTVIGPPMSIYYGEEFNHDANDTEIAVPIKERISNSKIFKGRKCAMAVIKGEYDKLSEGYAKIIEWISENNYEISGEFYEKYISGPIDSDDIITQIYVPVN